MSTTRILAFGVCVTESYFYRLNVHTCFADIVVSCVLTFVFFLLFSFGFLLLLLSSQICAAQSTRKICVTENCIRTGECKSCQLFNRDCILYLTLLKTVIITLSILWRSAVATMPPWNFIKINFHFRRLFVK